MYSDRDTKREELVSRIRMTKGTGSAFTAACLAVLRYDGEYQKIWDPATAREAFLRLTDVLIEHFEREEPREPWRS